MMKKMYIICLFLLCGLAAMAQEFEIVSVEHLEGDASAIDEKITEPGKGRYCAVIRIATQNITPAQRKAFSFGYDLGSKEVQRAARSGEIWLWVSPELKHLRIFGGELGQYEVHFVDYGIKIESCHTYRIVIRGKAIGNGGDEKTTPTKQILAFEVLPKDANPILEVDGQFWDVKSDGTANQYLDFGTYHYKVRAAKAKYLPKEGEVTLDNPDSTKMIRIILEPNFARVTLMVDADAEIWVNNEKKGTRNWTGILVSGIYRIECKQVNHETSVEVHEITPDMDGQTITLKSPKPICGSLKVESDPSFAKIYLDGKLIGKTPQFFSDVIIGSHELRIEKENYEPIIKEIVIEKGETLDIKNEKLKKKIPKVTKETDSKDDKFGMAHHRESVIDYMDNGVGFVTLNAATSYTGYHQPSYGFSVGFVNERKIGLFLTAMSDFHFDAMNPSLTCDSEGLVNGEYPVYTGESFDSRLSVMGGVVIGGLFCMRFGVGYGLRTRCLAISDGTLVKVADNSYSGVDVTAGFQFNLKGFTISIDAVTTQFKTIEGKVGLGYCWKRR